MIQVFAFGCTCRHLAKSTASLQSFARVCRLGSIPRPTFELSLHAPAHAARNVHKLLIDTASAEYFFCLDFFEDESVFRELFGPMVQVVEGDLAMSVQVGGPG